jgi:hypothetical protein
LKRHGLDEEIELGDLSGPIFDRVATLDHYFLGLVFDNAITGKAIGECFRVAVILRTV